MKDVPLLAKTQRNLYTLSKIRVSFTKPVETSTDSLALSAVERDIFVKFGAKATGRVLYPSIRTLQASLASRRHISR